LFDRFRDCGRLPVLLALGSIVLALISAAASPNRFSIAVVSIPLATCFYFLSAARQRQVWFAVLPWVVLSNQVPFQAVESSRMPFYHSEAILLLLGASLAVNFPKVPAKLWVAQSLVIGFASWIALAALVGASRSGWEPALSATRMAMLALLTFRAASGGPSYLTIFSGSITTFIGVLGCIAIFEALSRPDPFFYKSVGQLLGDSEVFAIHFSLYLPLAIGFGIAGCWRKPLLQIAIWLAILFGIGGLILSYSRSAWLGAFVGVGFVLAMCFRRDSMRKVTGTRLGTTVLILIVLAVLATTIGKTSEWFSLLGRRLGTLTTVSVLGDRTPVWLKGVVLIRDNPLFGDLRTLNWFNLFIGIAARAGLPALVLWLGALLASVQCGFHRCVGRLANPMVIGIFGGLIAFLINGVGKASLGEWVAPMYFTFLGFAAGGSFAESISPDADHNLNRFMELQKHNGPLPGESNYSTA
jgi:hypothetical protein